MNIYFTILLLILTLFSPASYCMDDFTLDYRLAGLDCSIEGNPENYVNLTSAEGEEFNQIYKDTAFVSPMLKTMFNNSGFREGRTQTAHLKTINSKSLKGILQRCAALKKDQDNKELPNILTKILYKEKNHSKVLEEFLQINEYLQLPAIEINNYLSLDETINSQVLPTENDTLIVEIMSLCNKLGKAKKNDMQCKLEIEEVKLLTNIIWDIKNKYNSPTAYSILQEINKHAKYTEDIRAILTFNRLKYRTKFLKKYNDALLLAKKANTCICVISGISLLVQLGKVIIWPSQISRTSIQGSIPLLIYLGTLYTNFRIEKRIENLKITQSFFLSNT